MDLNRFLIMNTGLLPYKNIFIPFGNGALHGMLTIPEEPKGLIIFVHGNGGNHMNRRSMILTDFLNYNGFATFLFDLLTEKENGASLRNLELGQLTERLIIGTEWTMKNRETRGLEIGYYGESAGATGAIDAARKLGSVVKAIVSRGQKSKLLLSLLDQVITPVLVLNGGSEVALMEPIWTPNGKSVPNIITRRDRFSNELFNENQKLSIVAKISLGWFDKHLNNNHQNNQHKWF